MAPVMFTLVSAKSHRPVQESHQSLLLVADFLRWDFPLSAQGNGVDIFPAIPTRDGGSLSISSFHITITVSHTRRAWFHERRYKSLFLVLFSKLARLRHPSPYAACGTIMAVQHLEHSTSQGTNTVFRRNYRTSWEGCNLTLPSTLIRKQFLSRLGWGRGVKGTC